MANIEPNDDDQPALASILKDLIQSPGWQWYCQQVEAEFGPSGIAKRLNVVRSQIPQGPGREYELTAKVDALYEAADAINALIKRPHDVMAGLVRKPKERPFETFRRTLGTRA